MTVDGHGCLHSTIAMAQMESCRRKGNFTGAIGKTSFEARLQRLAMLTENAELVKLR